MGMLCVWGNFADVLHFQLFLIGATVDSDLYCGQLDKVYIVLKTKYPALKQAILQDANVPANHCRLT